MKKEIVVVAAKKTTAQKLREWVNTPMGAVTAVSMVTAGSMAFVLSGIWLVQLTVL